MTYELHSTISKVKVISILLFNKRQKVNLQMFSIVLYLCILCIHVSNGYIQRGLEDPYAESPKRELIRIKACQGLAYNETIFPNAMGQSTQEEAAKEINEFKPLLEVDCSRSLKLFLCLLYFPVSTELKKPLPPCRSLCEQNRRPCERILKALDFQVGLILLYFIQ